MRYALAVILSLVLATTAAAVDLTNSSVATAIFRSGINAVAGAGGVPTGQTAFATADALAGYSGSNLAKLDGQQVAFLTTFSRPEMTPSGNLNMAGVPLYAATGSFGLLVYNGNTGAFSMPDLVHYSPLAGLEVRADLGSITQTGGWVQGLRMRCTNALDAGIAYPTQLRLVWPNPGVDFTGCACVAKFFIDSDTLNMQTGHFNPSVTNSFIVTPYFTDSNTAITQGPSWTIRQTGSVKGGLFTVYFNPVEPSIVPAAQCPMWITDAGFAWNHIKQLSLVLNTADVSATGSMNAITCTEVRMVKPFTTTALPFVLDCQGSGSQTVTMLNTFNSIMGGPGNYGMSYDEVGGDQQTTWTQLQALQAAGNLVYPHQANANNTNVLTGSWSGIPASYKQADIRAGKAAWAAHGLNPFRVWTVGGGSVYVAPGPDTELLRGEGIDILVQNPMVNSTTYNVPANWREGAMLLDLSYLYAPSGSGVVLTASYGGTISDTTTFTCTFVVAPRVGEATELLGVSPTAVNVLAVGSNFFVVPGSYAYTGLFQYNNVSTDAKIVPYVLGVVKAAKRAGYPVMIATHNLTSNNAAGYLSDGSDPNIQTGWPALLAAIKADTTAGKTLVPMTWTQYKQWCLAGNGYGN